MQNKIFYHDGYKYQLHKTYSVQTNIKPLEKEVIHGFVKLGVGGLLTINEGYAWDGCSGPTWDDRTNMRAGLGHDAFYQLFRERMLDLGWRFAADAELKRWMLEDSKIVKYPKGLGWLGKITGPVRAWYYEKALNLFGERAAKWQDEVILEAP